MRSNHSAARKADKCRAGAGCGGGGCRFAFIDFSAGPFEWGPIVGGKGVRTARSIPDIAALECAPPFPPLRARQRARAPASARAPAAV